jgi:hypothetical protein
MTDKEIRKLRKLFDSWIEQNQSHKNTYTRWRDIAKTKNLVPLANKLNSVIQSMDEHIKILINTKNMLHTAVF